MNNFIIQFQPIKFQIDNMKLQITNIEMQYNNMNASFLGEQLMNLQIQMLNTGLNSFTLGKSISMSSLDNYFIQLNNISNQINNIINTNKFSIQEMQMIMMQQNQIMKAPIINQNDFNTKENNDSIKMNLTFEIRDFYTKPINIVCNFGTKVSEALEMFSKRIGKNKNQFCFIFDAQKLDYNDDRKINQVFPDCAIILALKK